MVGFHRLWVPGGQRARWGKSNGPRDCLPFARGQPCREPSLYVRAVITFSSSAESSWTYKFLATVVVLPVGIMIASGLTLAVVSRSSGHATTDGGVVISGVMAAVMIVATLGTAAAIFGAVTNRLPSERKLFGPIPMTVSSAALLAVAAAAGLSPESAEWKVAAYAAAGAAVGSTLGWLGASRLMGRVDVFALDVSSVAIIDQHRVGGADTDGVVDGPVTWTDLLPMRTDQWWRVPISVGSYLVAMSILAGWRTGLGASAVFAVLVAATNALSRSIVSIGPVGLSVRGRWSGRPLLVIRLDQIVRASATIIDRRSRFKSDRQRSGSRLTISTRLGPALGLLLIDDTEVLIGLTDPAGPVAAIEELMRGQAD